MIQKQDHPAIRVFIPGISGTGKTTLLEKLIRRENCPLVFLFDHKQGDLARRFGVKSCRTAKEIVAATNRGGYVAYDPSQMFPGHAEQGFAFFCDFVFQLKSVTNGRVILAADELDNLTESNTVPDELLVILDQGRTFQIDCFFICQAMNTVNNLARKQATEIFAFRQGDARGVAYLVDKGFPESELLDLRYGEFTFWHGATGTFKKLGKAFEPKGSGRNLRGL